MPLEYWHLVAFIPPADIEQMSGTAFGLALMDAGFPLGIGGAYFTKNATGDDVIIVFFHGGPNQIFVRKYPKWAMRAMALTFRKLHAMGAQQVYACADRTLPRSEAMLRWLGGSPVGVEQAEGEIYSIELAKNPFIIRKSSSWQPRPL